MKLKATAVTLAYLLFYCAVMAGSVAALHWGVSRWEQQRAQ